jgi:hypothetical protein
MSADEQIEIYIGRVTAQLGAASFDEREKVEGEVRRRILESAERPGENVESVLARLGAPEKLGERYHETLIASQASRSYSPVVLLTAAFRRGLPGIVGGLIGLAAYWLGVAMLVFGLLALIWAVTHTGPHVPVGASMGNILKILGAGCFFVAFSTLLLRTLLRILQRRQSGY